MLKFWRQYSYFLSPPLIICALSLSVIGIWAYEIHQERQEVKKICLPNQYVRMSRREDGHRTVICKPSDGAEYTVVIWTE